MAFERKLDYYLISRRSHHNSGTKYNSQGLDDENNAANFVETEQLIYYDRFCISSVFIRGSVPLFWKQSSSSSHLKLTKPPEMTLGSFIQHFQKINQAYGRCVCVSLLSQSKQNEQILSDAFEYHMQSAAKELPDVRYESFDFSQQCKNSKFDQINLLVYKLSKILDAFGCYVIDLSNKQVHSK